MAYETTKLVALTEAEVISSIEDFLFRNGPYLEREHRQLARKCGLNEGKIVGLWQTAAKQARQNLGTMQARFDGVGGRFDALRPKIEEAKRPKVAQVTKMVWYNGRLYHADAFEKAKSLFLDAPQPAADEAKEDTARKAPEEPEKEEAQAGARPIKVGLPALIPPTPLPSKIDAAVVAMNEQHAIIENLGGKTVISSWEPSQINPARLVVVFQNKESFLLRYSNRTLWIEVTDRQGGTGNVRVPLAQWWLAHRDRAQFRRVIFRPGEGKIVSDCLNIWQGWGVEPKSGDWRLIRKHIVEVVAGGNVEFADYVVRWIAWAIQNPAAQAEVALVLIGVKGAGKGTLAQCLKRIFGAHAFQVTSREEVIGKFNGHLQDCILFIADEAIGAATSAASADFKE